MDVQDLLKRIEEIENQYDDSAVASERKEAEKSQKKKLREIRKLVADNDIEPAEKIKRLMVKCMQEVRCHYLACNSSAAGCPLFVDRRACHCVHAVSPLYVIRQHTRTAPYLRIE